LIFVGEVGKSRSGNLVLVDVAIFN